MRTGAARSAIALLAAIAVAALYSASPGCEGPVHVASCCKSHCPDHEGPAERTPCCGVPHDPGYPASATVGVRAPGVVFVHVPPGLLVASMLRPLIGVLGRPPDRIKVPIFLELLALRR
jgi:hypothetical protein